MDNLGNVRERPWTILLLVGLQAAGVIAAIYGSLTSKSAGGIALPGIATSILLIVGVWTRQRWAYALGLAATTFVFIFVLPLFVFANVEHLSLTLPAILLVLAQLALLIHPKTRAFVAEPDQPDGLMEATTLHEHDLASEQVQIDPLLGLGWWAVVSFLVLPLLWAGGLVRGLVLYLLLALLCGAGVFLLRRRTRSSH